MRLWPILLLALATPALAQSPTQGPPDMGIDTSGVLRKLSVRDAVLGTRVPLAVLDTTTHAFIGSTVPVELYGAKGDSNGTSGNGTDDTAAIQACVAISQTCELRPNATYRVTSKITFATRSGLVGPRSATVYADPASFTNTNYLTLENNNASVFYAKGSPTLLDNILLRGFRLVVGAGDDTTDGRFFCAIYFRGINNLDISDMEISGGALGFAIKLGSIVGGFIDRNYIHDFWEGTNSPVWPYPQNTAIETDDTRVTNGVTGGGSTKLKIRGNRIDRIQLGGALEDLGSGGGSDGVNLGIYGIDNEVSGNTISYTGEGTDTFASNGLIANNIYTNIKTYAIKIIHGASHNLVVGNVMHNVNGGVVVSGGALQPTTGNVVIGNSIDGLNPNNDSPPGRDPSCFRIEGDPTVPPVPWFLATNNRFVSNYCDTAPYGTRAITRGGGTGNEFIANIMSPDVGGRADTFYPGTDTQSFISTAKIGSFSGNAGVTAAATTQIFSLNTRSNWLTIAGSTTITSFGPGMPGQYAIITFQNALTLTHNTNIRLPGGANITTAPGDTAFAISAGGGIAFVVWYTRVDGKALVESTPVPFDTTVAHSWTARQSMIADSAGVQTIPLALRNAGPGAGTEVCMDMQPNNNGVGNRTAQVCSAGTGSDANLVFRTANGSTPAQSVAVGANSSGSTGGLMVGPSSVTDPGFGSIHVSGGVQLGVTTVALLPACSAAKEGMLRSVTDANSAVFNAAVAAGGANHMMAYCNGTGWVIR